jgi:hypothetical protein
MAAVSHTPEPGFATRFAFRRLAVVLAVVAALALAALTVAIVSLASGNGGSATATSATSAQVAPAAQPYTARPDEGLGALVTSSPQVPAPNDGSSRFGARP